MSSYMSSTSWLCDSCGRGNVGNRYQCQQCRGFNTYDLCARCIPRAHKIHPNHRFQLVQQGRNNSSRWNRRSTPWWMKGYEMDSNAPPQFPQ